jgi:DNA polymerase III epsilon subunit-like protein
MAEATYPEHQKLIALEGKNDTVGQFIEWLADSNYVICEYDQMGRYHPVSRPITSWLAQYFGIDPAKIEQEKRAMIDLIRAADAEVDR